MTYDEMIEVIAAHRDGKPIQYRCVGNEIWRDFNEDEKPTFNFWTFEFRVRPAPRSWVLAFGRTSKQLISIYPAHEYEKRYSHDETLETVLVQEIVGSN